MALSLEKRLERSQQSLNKMVRERKTERRPTVRAETRPSHSEDAEPKSPGNTGWQIPRPQRPPRRLDLASRSEL